MATWHPDDASVNEPSGSLRLLRQRTHQQSRAPGSNVIDQEYVETTNYLVLDSTERDRAKFPSTSSYDMDLSRVSSIRGNGFANVHSVELVRATVPDANGVAAEPYLLVRVSDQLAGRAVQGNNDAVSDSLAVLSLPAAASTGNFIHVAPADGNGFAPTAVFPDAPLASLTKLQIRITDREGTPFNFGTDTTPPTAPNKALQIVLMLRIVTQERRRRMLQAQPVF